MSEKIKVLFVVNRTKKNAEEIASRLSGVAAGAGFDAEICDTFPLSDACFAGKDICCVIGGDGTILSCVPHLVRHSLPVFGINLGKLGFLATYSDDIGDSEFLSLISGGGRVLERALLEARVGDKSYVALNDFVIKDSRRDGISNLRIRADSEFIADYLGDGLIFSTPTGSTAYNLSAGGPIIHPKARAFVMTPICPHTLSNRSLIYDCGAQIKVTSAGGGAILMADGTEVAALPEGGEIRISMPNLSLNFIRLRGHSHFSILRNNLGWAEDPRPMQP